MDKMVTVCEACELLEDRTASDFLTAFSDSLWPTTMVKVTIETVGDCQCEYCDDFIWKKDAIVFDDRHFCSDDCAQEDAADRWVGSREARYEFEMWGNDYDSWYR